MSNDMVATTVSSKRIFMRTYATRNMKYYPRFMR